MSATRLQSPADIDTIQRIQTMAKKKANPPHHISLYAGYGDTAVQRRKFLQKHAKKHQMKLNRFIWFCVGKVTGVDLTTTEKEPLSIRSYR